MTKFFGKQSTGSLYILVVLALTQPLSVSAQKPKSNAPVPSGKTPTNPRPVNQPSADMQVLMNQGWSVGEDQRRRASAALTMELYKLGEVEAQKLAQALSAKPIDYKVISQASSDLRDRAVKVKYSLPFVVKEKGEKVRCEPDPAQLDSMLAGLSRMLKSFIDNPVLRVRSPQDDELRESACHDLEGIIKLSGTISKTAKAMSKTLIEARK